jgi:hypothetical protein
MSFSAGEEVIVSIHRHHKSGTCQAVIIKSEEDRLQLALKGLGLVLRNGDLLHISSLADGNRAAWSCVQQVTLAGDVKIVQLTNTRFERASKPRSTRLPVEITLSANYSDREKNAKKTLGHTIDLSLSGVRAQLKSAVPEGSSVLLVMRLADQKTVEAMAKVARIVEDARSASGGYEVGLEFQRFIKGYEALVELAMPHRAA